jgi:hypothetical protein
MPYRRFGTTYRSLLQGSRTLDSWPLKIGITTTCCIIAQKRAVFKLWYLDDKSYVHPGTDQEVPDGEQSYRSTLSSTLTLNGGKWSKPRPGRFTPGKDPVPIVKEAGWHPGLVWTCVGNLYPTGIRSSSHPARNESLHRLHYLNPESFMVHSVT